MEADKINVHPMIRTDVPFTVLADNEAEEKDLSQILSLINADKHKELIASTASSNEKFVTLMETVEQWRSNIKNLLSCFENFRLSSHYPVIQKQSNKFVARIEDVISGLAEYGDQFDVSRTVVLVRTERSMLDMDRNKIYTVLFDICDKVAHSKLSSGEDDFDAMLAEQQKGRALPDYADQREKKENLELEDGSTYTGQTYNDLPDGEGVRNWPSKDSNDLGVKPSRYKVNYEGNSIEGKAQGYGQAVFANGDKYEGNWENDLKSGIGKQISRKGIILTGSWRNNYLEGEGKEVWTNGDIYEGNFQRSRKNGQGTFKFNDGSYYNGEFQDNTINGFGKYIWSDGRCYEGEFKNNKMEGQGRYTWPQGEEYKGDYLNDKRHGKGEFKWPDGRVYKGNFEDGRKHGDAEYTDKNGDTREGQWDKGKLVKWHS